MTTQHDPAVHVPGLQKSLKQLHVLRGVDFDVARGSSDGNVDSRRRDGSDIRLTYGIDSAPHARRMIAVQTVKYMGANCAVDDPQTLQ